MQNLRVHVIIPSLPNSKQLNSACINGWMSTAEFAQVSWRICESDGSFAMNCNIGLKELPSCDIVVISNNDILLKQGWDNWLLALTQLKSKKRPGIISFTDRADCGWLFAMETAAQAEVGLFDEQFVNSCEDYDYFIRMAKVGRGMLVAPQKYADHLLSQSIKRFASGPFVKQCEENQRRLKAKWPTVDLNLVARDRWLFGGDVVHMRDKQCT